MIDALDSAHAYSTRSLNAPFEDEGDDRLGDRLGVEERGYEEVEDGSVVAAGLDALDERERRIVELRFFEEMTQSPDRCRARDLPDARVTPPPARARGDARENRGGGGAR